jgi:hypothetical protein
LLQRILIYRLIIFNLMGAVGVGWATYMGWVEYLLVGDHTGIFVPGCMALFAVGLVTTFLRAVEVGRLVSGKSKLVSPEAFMEKNAHVDDISEWLVTLGLIGTVVGVSMAMGTVNLTSVDAAGIQAMVSALFGHMTVAFNVTITGSVLALWTSVNRRMLQTASVLAISELKVAEGE